MTYLSKKRLLSAVLILAGLITLAGCYYPAMEAVEQRTAAFPLTGRLALIAETDNGDITIHGQQGLQEVRVTATLRAWGPTQSDANTRLRNIKLELKQQGNTVTLRHVTEPQIGFGIFRSDQVAFEVWVPAEADLSLLSDNGDILTEMISGNIRAQSDNGSHTHRTVSGALDLRTDNGDIEVINGNGSLIASTDNGDVDYEGRLAGSQHRVTTDNGDIRLAIPRDSALRIEARVDNGFIHTELPVQGEMSKRHWDVVLNAPAAQLILTTDNGSITLEELK